MISPFLCLGPQSWPTPQAKADAAAFAAAVGEAETAVVVTWLKLDEFLFDHAVYPKMIIWVWINTY